MNHKEMNPTSVMSEAKNQIKAYKVLMGIQFLILLAVTSAFSAPATKPSFNLPTARLSNSCPSDFPLDCANGKCCPTNYTLYCPQLDPQPCVNPDKLSDEQLKTLADNCSPLLSCK